MDTRDEAGRGTVRVADDAARYGAAEVCAMTSQELDAIRARHSATDTGFTEFPFVRASLADVPALVAEVERLTTLADVLREAIVIHGATIERLRGLLNEARTLLGNPPPLSGQRQGYWYDGKCGAHQYVNTAKSLRWGWPRCCGQTMTIDSPEEQAAFARARVADQETL